MLKVGGIKKQMKARCMSKESILNRSLDRSSVNWYRHQDDFNTQLGNDIIRFLGTKMLPFFETDRSVVGTFAEKMLRRTHVVFDDPNKLWQEANAFVNPNYRETESGAQGSIIIALLPHLDVWDSPLVSYYLLPLLNPSRAAWIAAGKFNQEIAIPDQDFGAFASGSDIFAQQRGFSKFSAFHPDYRNKYGSKEWIDSLTTKERIFYRRLGKKLTKDLNIDHNGTDDAYLRTAQFHIISQIDHVNSNSLALGFNFLHEPGSVLKILIGGTRNQGPLVRSLGGIQLMARNNGKDFNNNSIQNNTKILVVGVDGTRDMYPYDNTSFPSIALRSDMKREVTFRIRALVDLEQAKHEAKKYEWKPASGVDGKFTASDWISYIATDDWMSKQDKGIYLKGIMFGKKTRRSWFTKKDT